MAASTEPSALAHNSAATTATGRSTAQMALDQLDSARNSGDPAAIRRAEAAVVQEYRPLADRIARRFRGRGVEVDDLVQLARLGLCKAVRRWRAELDPTLVQFATPTIEGEIKRYFRDHCRPIRMPRSVQEDLALHQMVQEELTQALGRSPGEAEVAAAAGSTVARVRRQRLASRLCQPVSADASAGVVTDIRCESSARLRQGRRRDLARIGPAEAAGAGSAPARAAVHVRPEPERDCRPDGRESDAGVADPQFGAGQAASAAGVKFGARRGAGDAVTVRERSPGRSRLPGSS